MKISNESLDGKATTNVKNNTRKLYIRDNDFANISECGFMFGIPYNNQPEAHSACGIGSIRGTIAMLLSTSLENYYNPSTGATNWICTTSYPGIEYSPQGIIVASSGFYFTGSLIPAGTYIIKAPKKNMH